MTNSSQFTRDSKSEIELTSIQIHPPSRREVGSGSLDSDTVPEVSSARPLLDSTEDDESQDDRARADAYVNKEAYKYFSSEWQPWLRRYGRWFLLVVLCLTSVAVALAVALSLRRPLATVLDHNEPTNRSAWTGFENIEYWFAFGDSWTTTHFWVQGPQPSTANPMGNPAFPGFTSSNGMNYVGYLGTQYNHSFIKIYDLAYSGSTIDETIDHSLFPWLDLSHQISMQFVKYYVNNDTGSPQPINWTTQNSLFSIFFGINDVLVYNRDDLELSQLFINYEDQIDRIYDLSARNFVIFNVPPMDKAPIITFYKTADEQTAFAADMDSFNSLIQDMINNLRAKHDDINIFVVDAHALFEQIIADPQSVPQTTGYKDTTHFCAAYGGFEMGMVPTAEQIQACDGLDINQYLWLDTLHVTPPAHAAIAAEMERLLTET